MKKGKRKMMVVLAVLLIMAGTIFAIDSTSFAGVRNVDILKIFAIGVLAGVLISTMREIYLERKTG